MAIKNEANADLIKKLEDEEGVDNSDMIEKIKSMSDEDETKNEVDPEKDETKNEGDPEKDDDDEAKNQTKNQIPKNTGGTPATFNELNELVPSSLDNREVTIHNMLAKGTTVAGAGSFVQNQLVAQVNKLTEQRETDNKIANETKNASPGRRPIGGGRGGSGGGGTGQSFETYGAAIKNFQDQGMTHAEAVIKANKEHADLRTAQYGPAARD